MLTPISGDNVTLYQGDRWVLELLVTDDAGVGVAGLQNLTFLLPDIDAEAPVVTDLGGGYYRTATTATLPGRHLVEVSVLNYGVTYFRAEVQDTSNPLGNIPDLADVKAYLKDGDAEVSTDDLTLQSALDAETAAQWSMCNVPAVYPVDLREALLRRVARNLALRGIPLAVLQGDAESGNLSLPRLDPEIKRLEAPHRKVWGI